jgi:hypothetical protein
MTNPYEKLPATKFWKTGVAQANPYILENIYTPKFIISPEDKIATAGSCFAQHITKYLKSKKFNVLDMEPAPPGLPKDSHQKFGYSTYSARYGNIYTARQLLQLIREASEKFVAVNFAWKTRNDYYIDAHRPAVEPEGLITEQEVKVHREYHLQRVKKMLKEMDIFIFTLGLTEAWMERKTKLVFPTAPGTIAGTYDASKFKFFNANYKQVWRDMKKVIKEILELRAGKSFKILLTVSPVPLTATASAQHVLVSTIHSKSILRAVASELVRISRYIDYFPSYEIINNPRFHSTAFAENLRSVRPEMVETVMNHFFNVHQGNSTAIQASSNNIESIISQPTRPANFDDVQCEEALLEAFRSS